MTARICNKCGREFDSGEDGINCLCQSDITTHKYMTMEEVNSQYPLNNQSTKPLPQATKPPGVTITKATGYCDMDGNPIEIPDLPKDDSGSMDRDLFNSIPIGDGNWYLAVPESLKEAAEKIFHPYPLTVEGETPPRIEKAP